MTREIKRPIWYEENLNWLKEHAPGHGYTEITEMWNAAHPNLQLKRSQIISGLKNHKINTGHDGRFTRGHVHADREHQFKPGCHPSIATEFKAGHIPANHKEVGSICWRADKNGRPGRGYFYIKIAEPREWVPLHKHLWIEANGPVPDGKIVVFKDNNPKNCVLENLALSTRQEMITIQKLGLFDRPGETFETVQLIAQLEMAGNRRKKEKKNDRTH